MASEVAALLFAYIAHCTLITHTAMGLCVEHRAAGATIYASYQDIVTPATERNGHRIVN